MVVDSKLSVTMDRSDESPSIRSPKYSPPQQGLLATIPSSWVPYAELMRIGKPAGLYAFYMPYVTGIFYAACIADSPPPPQHIFMLNCIFLVGSFVLRGAACTWNDNVDQDFDRKVTRCCLRPIARRAVTTAQGHVFTSVLTLAGLPLFVLLPLECMYHAAPVTILFALYPFAKRVTYYPQAVLGFPFAWAIFMCCAALRVDLSNMSKFLPTMSLFAANVIWTIIYDTIYAHQDIKDDVNAGVKSMAVRFAHSTKPLASGLAVIQIALLLATGQMAGLGPIFFSGICGGTVVALASMIVRVDLSDPASCAWWFHWGFWLVGGSVVVGLSGEYAKRLNESSH